MNSKISEFLNGNKVLYAATMGLDKTPQVHPVSVCYTEGDAVYFASAKCEMFYGELSMYPVVTLCGFDPETSTTLYVKGKPVFSEEREIVDRCLKEDGLLNQRWSSQPEMLIGWFLKDVTVQLVNETDGSSETFELGTPDNVITGITIKKDKEIRDRLAKIISERETLATDGFSREELELQKLYDGALLYFAEEAKKLWPRMDIMPAERSVLYETYDEREQSVNQARKLIGNRTIDKPEDLTYWLNKETLSELKTGR